MSLANYDLPEDKIREVMKVSGAKTKKEAIIISMDEYLRKKNIQDLIAARGKIKLSWTQKSLRAHRG
jgi:hypothetical protein